MKSMLLVSVLLSAVCGCGPQRVVVELTPLEEYKLAADLVDRENNLYVKAKKKLDPDNADDVEWLERQYFAVERARDLMKKASRRLDESIAR